jgi:hypothetical protein
MKAFLMIDRAPPRHVAVGLLVLCLWQAAAAAQSDGPAPAAAPQVWLISTRCAPRCGDLEAGLERIAYWRLDPCDRCRWIAADAQTFHRDGDAAVPTAVFVSGYTAGPNTAIEEGGAICCDIERAAPGRPFRFVIWWWPGDRDRHARISSDLRAKASECDAESYYLARTLPAVCPGTSVGLIGYSYGARIVGGALELLAGGEVAGHSLPAEARADWAAAPRPVRAMFIGAAMDADWLAPGHRDGDALTMVQRLAVTQNCCDRALRFYTRLDGRGGPQALGWAGPLGHDGDKLEVLDVACSVGKKHDWYRYKAAPQVAQRLARYTFLAE